MERINNMKKFRYKKFQDKTYLYENNENEVPIICPCQRMQCSSGCIWYSEERMRTEIPQETILLIKCKNFVMGKIID